MYDQAIKIDPKFAIAYNNKGFDVYNYIINRNIA